MRRFIPKFAIHLVGQRPNLMLFNDDGDLLHLIRRNHRTGGIVRAADNQRLGFRRNERFDGCRRRDKVIRRGIQPDRFRPAERHQGLIRNIARFRNNHLIPRVKDGTEHNIDCFRNAEGNQYLVFRRIRHTVAVQITGNGLAERFEPPV